MNEAKRIKKSYCRPPVYIEETEWRKFGTGTLPNHFHIERYCWIDKLIPEYRVAIPEEVALWGSDESEYREFYGKGIQTRFVTYLPTGRQIYDNTLHPAKAIIFEYELEHYVRAANDLKDLAHLKR
jgi:hypothetical protein